jgi:hypothetical protein
VSKIRIALTLLLATLAVHSAVARAASGGGVVSEPFYSGGDALWVLMHDAHNDGYQCSVSFVTTNGTYSIHGPLDAEMAKTGTGMLWFESPRVPKPASPSQRVTLAVHGNDGELKWPAMQTTIGKASHGTLIVAVQIASVLKEKADTNDLSISLDGNEVYRAKLVEIQKAYARLGACMAAR